MAFHQRTILKLDSFAVRTALQKLNFAELSYKECMDLLQELLELPQTTGTPLGRKNDAIDQSGFVEDWSEVVVEMMIEAGYEASVAWKCRNSAASKAFKLPLKSLLLHDSIEAARLLLAQQIPQPTMEEVFEGCI